MPEILKSNRYYSGPLLSSTANVLQSPQFSAFSDINPDICKHINLFGRQGIRRNTFVLKPNYQILINCFLHFHDSCPQLP